MKLTKDPTKPVVLGRRSAGSGVLVLLAALAMVGCGPATADLSGTVTIGGQPIPEEADAQIGFVTKGAPPEEAVSGQIVSGKYSVAGVPLGPVNVSFSIVRPVGPSKISARTGQAYQETEYLVPPRRAAGFDIEVTADSGTKDFDL